MLLDYGKIELRWIVPDLNRWRYYSISVEPGLFGPVLARSWGRLGWERFRVKEQFFAEGKLMDALAVANRLFTAKRRKGYEILE